MHTSLSNDFYLEDEIVAARGARSALPSRKDAGRSAALMDRFGRREFAVERLSEPAGIDNYRLENSLK